MSLEKIVGETRMKNMEKIMITGDYHIPFEDVRAVKTMLSYAKRYKPNKFVINGDFMDFYTLSTFDKSPDRKTNIKEEIHQANMYLNKIQRALPKSTQMYFLDGNHEIRWNKYFWKNPEMKGLKGLSISEQLNFKERGIKYVNADPSYWKNDNGHLKFGDLLIMHGDNRINGATSSINSGYSSGNTIKRMLSSVAIGHNHRLAKVHQRAIDKYMVGLETGCLCELSGTSNWMNGFVTLEKQGNKTYNHRTHHIINGVLIEDGKRYKG